MIQSTLSTAHQEISYCKDLFVYNRRKTRTVMVGDVAVGGDNPIRIQSMTTTRTQDTDATVAQTIRLVQAGCEIVRITAPTEVDSRNLKNIHSALRSKGIRVPLVADIHFRPEAAMEAAEHVDKVRVNPGNFADAKAFKIREYSDQQYQEELDRIEERFTPLVLKLKKLGRALRIGTNHGSLSDRILNRFGDTPEGMVESALEFVRICRKNGFNDIILSMKASNPKVMIAAYRLLVARMNEEEMDYPLHLGVTEAGDGEDGRIKSAIGIGSLLEDGLGDTIRVSLTEEPEFEIPVAKTIASSYDIRSNKKSFGLPPNTHPDMSHTEHDSRYKRRDTREIAVGPIRLGGQQPIRVITKISPIKTSPEALLEQLKSSKNHPPEILEWTIKTDSDGQTLKHFRNTLKGETSRIAHLVNMPEPQAAQDNLWECADAVIYALTSDIENGNISKILKDIQALAQRARDEGKPVFLKSTHAEKLLLLAQTAAEITKDVILSLQNTDISYLIRHTRFLCTQEWINQCKFPIHIPIPSFPSLKEHLIQGSILTGALLCDGIGDSIQAGLGQDLEEDLHLSYNLLQGAGSRITKTEYVSCPSCGRTLFDLQTTTERIKSQTNHLKGVKIAIMGCIVNGPGEMADADFGYVGGGPGKINLYVGKTCVEKGIPTEIADNKLIELIKKHNKWVTPPPKPS